MSSPGSLSAWSSRPATAISPASSVRSSNRRSGRPDRRRLGGRPTTAAARSPTPCPVGRSRRAEPTGVGWGRLLAALAGAGATSGPAPRRAVGGMLRATIADRCAGAARRFGRGDRADRATGRRRAGLTADRAHGRPSAGRRSGPVGIRPAGSRSLVGCRRRRRRRCRRHDRPDLAEVGDRLDRAVGWAHRFVERRGRRVSASTCHAGVGLAVGWARRRQRPIGVLDVDDIDPAEPWRVDFGGTATASAVVAATRPRDAGRSDRRPVARRSARTGRVARWHRRRRARSELVMATAIKRMAAWRRRSAARPVRLRGDARVARSARPPARGGSIGRYWFEEWARRPDLHAVVPGPDGRRTASGSSRGPSRAGGPTAVRPMIRATSRRPSGESGHDVGREPGVNVIGYIASDSGLGDFTRRLYRSLDDAGSRCRACTTAARPARLPAMCPDLTTDGRS